MMIHSFGIEKSRKKADPILYSLKNKERINRFKKKTGNPNQEDSKHPILSDANDNLY